MSAEFDSPWKEALAKYFRPLIELCFPRIAAEIDWAVEIELLETELHELMRASATGRQFVDKLVRVRLLGGEHRRILIHVEVQHSRESDFAARVFSYYTRLLEKGEPVVTAAILADTERSWRPKTHETELLGCHLRFDFPVCKLLDLVENRADLEKSHSPAAVLVLANWAAQQTRARELERLNWKLRLTRELYEKGLSRDDILELYRLIDWMIELRPELESHFRNEIIAFEEQKHMPYVTSIERLGMERGRNEGIEVGRNEGIQLGRNEGLELGRSEGIEHGRKEARNLIVQALETRFTDVPSSALDAVSRINGAAELAVAHRLAITCRDIHEFLKRL